MFDIEEIQSTEEEINIFNSLDNEYKEYQEGCEQNRLFLNPMILKTIFSVTNETAQNNEVYKVINILGIKIKFKNFKRILENTKKTLENEIFKQKELVKYWQNEYSSYNTFYWRGINDCSPNSFKEYFLKNNIPEKIEKLKSGLNERSKNIIDSTLLRIAHLPDYKYAKFVYVKGSEFETQFDDDDCIKYKKLVDKYLPEAMTKFKLEDGDYEGEVFVYHHGLRFANDKIKQYIAGKDFIDAGAYIGDSTLVFMEYNPKKVYAFDMSKKSYHRFLKTMELNNIPDFKYSINNIALLDEEIQFQFNDIGTGGTKIFDDGCDSERSTSTTLDKFAQENNLHIGFIKADIEGAMLKMLKGMINCVQKDRPAMSLSIYHSPEEFFETKPLLQEILKDLNYNIEIDCHFSSSMHICGTIIWAYPRELKD